MREIAGKGFKIMENPCETHARAMRNPCEVSHGSRSYENRQNSRGDFYNFHAWLVKIFPIDDRSILYCLSLWLKEKNIVCHFDWKKLKKSPYHEILYQLLHNYPWLLCCIQKNWHLRNASQLRSLTSHMIVTPAESICNQFEPWSGPNPLSNFDTLMVFLELT